MSDTWDVDETDFLLEAPKRRRVSSRSSDVMETLDSIKDKVASLAQGETDAINRLVRTLAASETAAAAKTGMEREDMILRKGAIGVEEGKVGAGAAGTGAGAAGAGEGEGVTGEEGGKGKEAEGR